MLRWEFFETSTHPWLAVQAQIFSNFFIYIFTVLDFYLTPLLLACILCACGYLTAYFHPHDTAFFAGSHSFL